MQKRILSTLLCLVMLAVLIPHISFAEVNADENSDVLSIEAQYKDTVKLQKSVGTEEDYNGNLILTGGNFSVGRDYSQKCDVTVRNTSNTAIKYHLECVNNYDDISVNFVKEGSIDNPSVIQSGETQNIELSIFTQNAENVDYELPIYAYTDVLTAAPAPTGDGEPTEKKADSKTTIYLRCNQPDWNVSLNMTSSDASTLSKTYSLRNNGADISDVYVYTDGEVAEYTKYYPLISNYQLNSDDSVYFTLSPDLAKMKENNKSVISGNLVVKSGANKLTQEISFDTKGAEINSTTMGELGLVQDNNPYYKLALNDEAVKSTIKVGEENIAFEDVLGDKKLNEVTTEDINNIAKQIFNESVDYCFDISEEAELSYGIDGETIGISTRIYVTSGDYAETAADDDWYTFDPSTGVLTVTDTKRYNSKEYEQLAAEIMASVGKGIDIPGTISEIVIPNDHTDFQVHVEKKFVKEAWKTATEDIDFIQDINGLNKGLKVYSTLSDVVKVGSVIENPNYDDATKAGYAGLKAAKNVLRWASVPLSAHPVGFIAAMIGEYCIDQMISDLEDSMELRDGSAMYYDVYGSQCTNRGSVTADFYVPNFRSNDIELYETGRMFSGNDHKYVNNYDTKYDYYLNKNKIGSSENNGLTEVNMLKLPIDSLKFGSLNQLTWDYNTNPGNHYVTTNSEITLIYPSDAEVSYIGSPESLEDVRLHPDFAVYTENVYADSDLVVGEANKLKFNVYNRGSQSGWVTISISDGGSEIYRQENVFMEAFSSKSIELDWTPTLDKNNIEVALENKTVGIEERKTDNNVAKKVIAAEKRTAPKIINIEPKQAFVDDEICVTANISSSKYVKDVRFYIDNVMCEGSVQSREADEGSVQYYIVIPALSAGKHSIKAETEYFVNKTDTALLDKTADIDISSENKITFGVDNTIVNPSFTVTMLSENGYEATKAEVLPADDGAYIITLKNDMIGNIDNCRLFLMCDGGFINIPISDLLSERKTLSLNNCKNLEFSLPPEKGKIKEISIEYVDNNSIDKDIRIPCNGPLKLSPASYDIDVQLEDDIGGISLYDIDLTENDGLIDLSNYIIRYEFELKDEDLNSLNYINAHICYTDSGEMDFEKYYLNSKINKEANTVSCSSTSRWLIKDLSNSDKAYLYLHLNDTLYRVDIKANDIPRVLSKADLINVGFKMDDQSKPEIMSVSVLGSNGVSYTFNADNIYLPKDIYDISITYKHNSKQIAVKDKIDLSEADDKFDIELETENEAFVDVALDLPSIFDKVAVSDELSDFSNGTLSFEQVLKSKMITLLEGNHKLSLTFLGSDNKCSAIVKREIDVNRSVDNVIAIDTKYSGEINYLRSIGSEVHFGDKDFSISLDTFTLKDKYNNILKSYYASKEESYLVGSAKFVSVSNPEEVYEVPISGRDLYSINGKLPNVSGEFNVFVSLAAVGIEPEGLYINASAEQGGSISPSGAIEVQEGESAEFKIKADSGYKISDVLVDDVSVGAVKSYKFENITEPHTIVAKFEVRQSTGGGGGWTKNSGLSTGAVTPASPSPSAAAVSASPIPSAAVETTQPITQSKQIFADVAPSDWFSSAVNDLYSKGVITGTTDTTFSPYDDTTRAAVITMLYRMSGSTELSDVSVFNDVESGMWYSNAVVWGTNNGIVSGNGDGGFAPNRAVTREELVKMIIAYVRYKNSENIKVGDISGFADANSVSGWALESMQAAYGSGIISGYPEDNTIRPQATATRAELAQVIWNLNI